jgi:hypothetical protein
LRVLHVRVEGREAFRLHSAPHNVERVRRALSRETCEAAKGEAAPEAEPGSGAEAASASAAEAAAAARERARAAREVAALEQAAAERRAA